mgnify:FL=1
MQAEKNGIHDHDDWVALKKDQQYKGVKMPEEKASQFAIFAESDDFQKPLIQINLTFERLIDDIIHPLETDKPFFIDGATLTKKKVKKIKIIRQCKGFNESMATFHTVLHRAETAIQKLYGEQYHTRIEAILRTHGEDVTSQALKAYDTSKKEIKDYLPKRDDFIKLAAQIFWEGLKKLGGNNI